MCITSGKTFSAVPKSTSSVKVKIKYQDHIFLKQEGHDGPVSLHWLICEIPSYQALQYLRIGLKHRPLTRTKIGSHSSYVKQQEDFERFHHKNPCNPWQAIQP